MGAYHPLRWLIRTSRSHCTFFLVSYAKVKKEGINLAVKTCPVCGKTVSNSRSNTVYCNPECRQKARNKRRSHKGNKKIRQPTKIVDRPKNHPTPYDGTDPLEYWCNYKERILESEREFNFRGVHLVGGIEVHEENFEYLVVEQIENIKRL